MTPALKKPKKIAGLTAAEVQEINAALGGRWQVLKPAGGRHRSHGQTRQRWHVRCRGCQTEEVLFHGDLVHESVKGSGRARSTGCRSRKCARRWEVSAAVVKGLQERLVIDLPRYLESVANDALVGVHNREREHAMRGEE